MMPDINVTLLHHLSTGSGAAYALRKPIPRLLERVDRLFRCRSDVQRLLAAQQVAALVLKKNDFDDLLSLRDIVATQELRRQISYARQKDHTAHTVYLYLLGIWLFDHLQVVRENFATKHQIKNQLLAIQYRKSSTVVDKVDQEFLFHWVYASLLHDVGYAFADLTDETAPDRKAIDDLFSWKSVRRLYESIPMGAKAAIEDAHKDWSKREQNGGSLIGFRVTDCRQVLDYLANAQWIKDLIPTADGDLFDLLELDARPLLRKYAYEVAISGYNHNGAGIVDHAAASGLFLLRYTAFWYWLMNHVRQNSPGHLQAVTSGFNYDVSNLVEDIIPACRAVAFHNVRSDVAAASEIIPLLTLKKEPLLFLSVLADELQFWDRPPSGHEYLSKYQEYAKSAFDGSDVSLFCAGPRSVTKAVVHIRSGSISRTRSRVEAQLRATLSSRLPGWEELVELQVEKKQAS